MSIGNTNFITLDSIAEIQDIVNGDYLFTVSNGVIYKLDFQNLILTPDNVDFYTTIESLSTQVVSLTNAFSAVNSQMNTLSTLGGVGTLVHEQSAGWTSTNSQVQTLSATTWLPVGSQSVQAGSLISYVGGSDSWQALSPGLEGDSLIILDNVPQFTGNTGVYKNIDTKTATYQGGTQSGSTTFLDVVPLVSVSTGGQNYSYIGITWDVNFNGGEGDGTINQSRLLIQYGDGRASQIIAGGSYAIIDGTQGKGQTITFTVIPQADFGNTHRAFRTPGGNLTKGRKLGQFSALGSAAGDTDRSFDVDPVIITDVLNERFDSFVPLIAGDPGGVPSQWKYDRTWGASGDNTGVLWESAQTWLNVYGSPS
jgi:hypothetical protein